MLLKFMRLQLVDYGILKWMIPYQFLTIVKGFAQVMLMSSSYLSYDRPSTKKLT